MFLHQFYVESLGHYSYLIGSTDAGVGFVVDPKLDGEDYLADAQAAKLRITHILETHLHNDYISGSRELESATGATICHSAEAEVAYPHQALRDGDALRFGELEVRVLATPGHTPEHVCFVVYDTKRSERVPALILTGGDLLVGSVGRPDLLGEEVGGELAPMLYRSLHEKILPVGDAVQVLPTHGAGSSCGADISSTRRSTIGYEKATNPYLRHADSGAFVEAVLHGQPAIPAYYKRMRSINKAGAPVLGGFPRPRPLAAADFARSVEETGGVVLDTRLPLAFGGGHIPGAVNIGLDHRFSTWAGSVLPDDRPIYLVLERDSDLEEAVCQLMRIGFEKIGGYLLGGVAGWIAGVLPTETLPQFTARDLNAQLDAGAQIQVLDVRRDDEWDEKHISGAIHTPVNQIQAKAERLPRDRPLAVICATGYRSSVAASLLRKQGFSNVINVIGGMSAWNKLKYPVVKVDGE